MNRRFAALAPAPSLQEVRDVEVLAIPPDAARKGSPTRTTGIADIEVALDGPVVGHVKDTPLAIVEVGLGHRYGVAKGKAPVLIKTLSVTSLRRRKSAQDTNQKYDSLHLYGVFYKLILMALPE
jgi:hypothetical protein